MPEPIAETPAPAESPAHEAAEEQKLETIEDKVDSISVEVKTRPERPPWFEDLVDAVSEQVFDKSKKFVGNLVDAQEAAAEIIATEMANAPTGGDNESPPPPAEEQQEDVKPKRSHRLFGKPFKRPE